MRNRIEVELSAAVPTLATAIELRTGAEYFAEQIGETPAVDVAAQTQRVVHKFQRLAQPLLGAARTGVLRERVFTLVDAQNRDDFLDLAASNSA